MEDIILIVSIFGIHFSAWLTPGPTFLLLFRNTLVYGRSVVIWNALAILCSNIIHTSYAILVLTIISGFAEKSMFWIQIAGSVYFIYLGCKTVVRSKYLKLTTESENTTSYKLSNVFQEAFFTNLLSPKASLFFLGIFSSVIERNPPSWAIIFLWIGLPINSFILANCVGYIVSRGPVRKVYEKYSREIGISLGVVMIFLGFSLFLIH